MKSLLLYFALFTLCLPSFDGGARVFDQQNDVSIAPLHHSHNRASQHHQHMLDSHLHQSASSTNHNCCEDEDSSAEPTICCDNVCQQCAGDCSGSNLALVAKSNKYAEPSADSFALASPKLPPSPLQNELIPPIS